MAPRALFYVVLLGTLREGFATTWLRARYRMFGPCGPTMRTRVLSGSLMPIRPPPSQQTLVLTALAALLLVTVAVYARGLNGEFQFDDQHTIQVNRSIRHLDNFFTSSAFLNALGGKRVLTDFTFALNYRAAGFAPLPFHLTNLAVHLAATLLVFFFTRRTFALGGASGRDLWAALVAGLFALHPLQTQAVAYLSQRAESVASALYLGSLLLLLRVEARGRSLAGVLLYAGSFALFALGLSSKVIVATLPITYLMIGVLPGPQQRQQLARTSRRVALASPFFAYALSTTILGLASMTGEDAGFAVPSLPPSRYFLTQWHVLVTYLRLTFWPADQRVDWDFPVAGGLGDPAVLMSGLFLIVVLVVAGTLYLRFHSRSDDAGATVRLAVFGLAWFFILLAPTSSLIPLADVLMEHRLYLASWGVFLAGTALAAKLVQRVHLLAKPRVLAAISICLCAGLALATQRRVDLWRTRLALWGDCVAKSPRKARPHQGLGDALRIGGKVEQAVAELRLALDLAKKDTRWIRQSVREDLIAALLALGRADEAVSEVQAGLAEKSDDAGLLGLLAMVQLRRHDLPAAEAAAEASVHAAREDLSRHTTDHELGPGRHLAASFRMLGLVRLAQGRQQDATAALEEAVTMDPDEAQGKLLLATAYRAQGRLDRACNILSGQFDELQTQAAQARAGCPGS